MLSKVEIRSTLLPAPFLKGAGRLPFKDIAEHILGKQYELSLVICGDTLARRMNIAYRKKSYKPNVLSFPLSKKEGEIFLNIRKAAREARAFNSSIRAHTAYLFVHGCFHLHGLDHGKKMEIEEARVMRRFKLA